jgi:DNA-binding transcriptional MocR family regulator
VPPRPPLNEAISDHLARQISTGALKPGNRVPSVRLLSRRFKVSTNTVLHAFARLEALALVEARPRSGYYVRFRSSDALPAPRPGHSRGPAVPLALGERLPGFFRAMRQPGIVPLGAAAPGVELLPAQRLGRLLAKVARVRGASLLGYDPLPGLPVLRRQIARRLAALGASVSEAGVVTTVGAIEAIALALRAVTKPGDAVLVESPGYFGVLQLLRAQGLQAVEVPCTSEHGLDVELAERAMKRERVSAVVVVPTFSNPLGSLMPLDAKRALVSACAAREVPLIESDVYGELPFEGERPLPLVAFDRDGGVLHCSSFSKVLAPGFRCGWICPGRFQPEVEEAKFTQTVATPAVLQAALAELLFEGGYDRHLRALRRALKEQVQKAREALASSFPAGTRVSDPRGGFLLWVELPRGAVDAIELQRRALEHGISIAPGPLFSARDGFSRCFRLSCGHPWSPAFDRAVATLGRLCRA